jgi:uncharacterized LabA/DUF88 family protein
MNVGILWDIENVTPPTNTNYIQSVMEKVSADGRISYAMAFGNWNNNSIKNIAHELSINNFELIHIPNSGKNSTDMSLVAHGVELIFQYPHIERFVLISGDADFRPLLVSQKKYGKETWVICDVKNNASENLLKMADKYFDYREIISVEENFEINGDKQDKLTKQQAFELFKEAISIMIDEKKNPSTGSVKIKMKLLNNQFNESLLGYNSWNDFVKDALSNTHIVFDNDIFLIDNHDQNIIPEIFKMLIDEIGNNNEWVLFTKLAEKINYKGHGYNRFKKLALDAEKRGYVALMNKSLTWYMKKN